MKYPEESIQHSVHGESLKFRIILDFCHYYYIIIIVIIIYLSELDD